MCPVARDQKPTLPHIIIGTAGHVDHGKTSLIRFLTGCETDNLKEEKERGLSINLGFAACRFPGNRVVGVVDVPGHIDFIRNMVSGAASIDILLLVIAADDGVMPQTKEHMQIVSLLRTPKVMVALTKTDLVEPEMLELAQEEVRDFLDDMGFPDAPIVPVSNVTFEGINDVRRTLDKFIQGIKEEEDNRLFRMNVERIFSIKGMGTVATGIPVSGQLFTDDKLQLQPGDKQSTVRAIHNYKHKTDTTAASICSAINIRDIAVDDVARGMTLSTPGAFPAVNSVMATLKNVSREFPLKHNTEVKFHSGTAESNAKVVLIENNVLNPGDKTVVKIKLEKPLVLVAGDKYIIRKLSPSITYGGGSIMASGDYRFKRSSPPFQKRLLKAQESVESGDYFEAELLASEGVILSIDELNNTTHLKKDAASKLIEQKIKSKLITQLDKNNYLISERSVELLPKFISKLKQYHHTNKYSLGMMLDQVADFLKLSITATKKLTAVLRSLSDEIEFQKNRFSLSSFEPQISRKLIEQKDKLQDALISSGSQGLARGDIKQELSLSEADMKLLVKILIEEELLTVIGNRLLSNKAFDSCRRMAIELFLEVGSIDIPKFRDKVGVSRNMAVTILEKFDSLGYTSRTEEGRMWVNPIDNNKTVEADS